MRDVIVLIDGEHHPDVTARAIVAIRERGDHPVAALLLGGGEKLGQVTFDLGVAIDDVRADPLVGLATALDRTGCLHVIDISDEPVQGDVSRFRMASVAAWKGASYEGAGFAFDPPSRPKVARVPSVGVIGTGKRTGKTTIACHAAKLFRSQGRDPLVVAMGRGGPPEPQLTLSPPTKDELLRIARSGMHAASDFLEDALFAGVPTIGAWRAGGGLAGPPFATNYVAAMELANEQGAGMFLLEGSGSSIPPAHADACVLIVPVGIEPEQIESYFGLYRLLLADLVVITMDESASHSQSVAIERLISKSPLNQPKVVRTIFRPTPMGEVRGRRIWFATTAPKEAGRVLKEHLEKEYQAEVVGISHSLADRDLLHEEIAGAMGAETICVELKAAAVDVVVEYADSAGIDVVFVENVPAVVGEGDLDGSLTQVAELANERFSS